jgi:lysozyme family protein
MDNFARCLAFTLGAEGGFSNNPADPGNWTGSAIGHGALHGTKYGISAAVYPGLNIALLSEDQAAAIYKRDYWNLLRGDELATPIALVAFDAAVNAGPRRAVMWLQQAVSATPDGVIGPATIAALRAGDPLLIAQEALVRRLDFSTRLPAWQSFSLGWSRRIIALAIALRA